MSALAVADGEGRNGVWLAGQGLDVLSIDASRVGLAKARALADRHGVDIDLEVADLSAWEWPRDRFDLVAAIFIQFAGPELRSRLFEGFQRTIRPGGVLLVEGYGERQLRYRTGGPGIPENLYQMRRLLMAFPGWEILASRDADIVLSEGNAHSGISHSVAAVLRKPVPGAPTVRG